MTVEIGARYFYRGRTYIVRERELRLDKGLVRQKDGSYGPEHYLCISPEDRADARPHWTDWIPEAHVERHFTVIDADASVETVERRGVAAIPEQAAAAARSTTKLRAGVTPKKRLQNRITSTRYKMKHPEKNGRSEWSGHEIAEMERTIAETQSELAAL